MSANARSLPATGSQATSGSSSVRPCAASDIGEFLRGLEATLDHECSNNNAGTHTPSAYLCPPRERWIHRSPPGRHKTRRRRKRQPPANVSKRPRTSGRDADGNVAAGPERAGDIPSCPTPGGDAGRFHYTPRGSCTATNLQPRVTVLAIDSRGPNFTGHLSDVFTCIARVGDSGCYFRQPLAAIARALGADGQPPPPENAESFAPFLQTLADMIGQRLPLP